MRLRWRPRGRLAIAAVAVALLLTGGIVLAAALRQPVSVTVRAIRIGVIDGPRDNQHVELDASFFTPAGQGRLPAILLAPGFGETREGHRLLRVPAAYSSAMMEPTRSPRPGSRRLRKML
jgi:ABC-2 type transport system ATP-binding protein